MDFVEQNQIDHEAVLAHWYYQSKFKLLAQALKSAGATGHGVKLADIGCGLGVFLTLLERSGLLEARNMIGIDPAAPDGATSAGGNVPIHRAAPAGEQCDVILLMDVLEHVEDDKAVLAQALDLLAPKGYAFITVPAFKALWSRHDELLGHYRRYTAGSLGRVIAALPQLRLMRLHYYYASILPPAAVVRLLRRNAGGTDTDMAPCHPALNAMLKFVLGLELAMTRANRVAGLTVVALCQKT